jgi:hypothetical protein
MRRRNAAAGGRSERVSHAEFVEAERASREAFTQVLELLAGRGLPLCLSVSTSLMFGILESHADDPDPQAFPIAKMHASIVSDTLREAAAAETPEAYRVASLPLARRSMLVDNCRALNTFSWAVLSPSMSTPSGSRRQISASHARCSASSFGSRFQTSLSIVIRHSKAGV